MSRGWFYLVVDNKHNVVQTEKTLHTEDDAVDAAQAALQVDPKETFYVCKAIKLVHRPTSLVEATEDPEIPF